MRGLRVVLSTTGFGGSECWSVRRLPAPYPFPFLGRPIIRVGLLRNNDGSNARSLTLPIATCSQEPVCRTQTVPGFVPASRIDGQSLPWGRCISLFTSAAGDCTQHRASSCQGSLLASHPWACLPISGERIARTRKVYHTLKKQSTIQGQDQVP